MADNERADWQGVGESFRDLGIRLKDHAAGAGDAMKSATTEAEGAADEITGAIKAAFSRFDDATKDPAIGASARTATARLLDALKIELTGSSQTPPEPPTA